MSGEAASYRGARRPDPDEVARYAAVHSETDDSNTFSSVLSNIFGRDDDDDKDADEDEVKRTAEAHDRVYNQQGEASSRDLGSAAALQAFKLFSSKKSEDNGGGSSTELIGMAMGEAMKLLNSNSGKHGNVDQGDMLQSAAMTAMKLFATYQSSQKPAEQSSGGLGALMGLLGSSGNSGGAASLLSKFL